MNNEVIIAVLGSAGLFSVIEVLIKIISGKLDNKNSQKSLLIAIAHDRIIHLCKEPLKRGSITSEEIENINTIGEAYVKAGGNHLAKRYLGEIQKLPIRND